MNLILFFYIAVFFSLTLGEFGQFPFGRGDFSISITDILLTLNLAAVLIWKIAVKKNLELPRNFLFLGVFWTVGILSLFFSLELSGWLYLVRFIVYSSAFYLSFHLINSGILNLKEFLTLLKVNGIALALLGFGQLIIYPDLEALSALGYDPHKFRLFSTFLDPNFLGTYLNFSFVLVIFELLGKKKENKFNILTAVLLGAAIILTFSRSAYLISAVSLVIILAVRNKKLLAGFLSLVVVLYLIFPAFNDRINGAINVDASARERFSSWDKGLIIFQKNPILGVGFNNIRVYSQNMDLVKLFSPDGGNSGSGVDSSLIFILATTGLTGFLTYAIFLIRVISDLVSSASSRVKAFYNLKFRPVKLLQKVWELPGLGRWYRELPPAQNVKFNELSLPLFALTLGLLANSFFINSLFFPPIIFLWFSLLGVFYGLGGGEGS